MLLSPRSLALLALPLLLLTACPLPGGGGTTQDAGPTPPTPDAGPGDAGLHPDTTAPTVFITDPANSLSTTQATVQVSGDAMDDVGIVALESVVGTTVTPLAFTSTGPNSVIFSFEVPLELGLNDIAVRARDAAGRTSVAAVTVTREAPAATLPTITRFAVDKQGVEPGETVVFSWEVSGTAPVTLTLQPDGLDVTGQSQASLSAPSDDTEYRLVASNEAGTVEQSLLLGVGGPLRLYPERAVVVPGARQRVQVSNARLSSGRWTVSPAGGTLQVEPAYFGSELQKSYGIFSASALGTYTLTFTTDEAVPRSGTLTIEVRAVASRVARLEGLGGQVTAHSSVSAGALALDPSGALWTVTSEALGRLDPISGRWGFVPTRRKDGSLSFPEELVVTLDGDVWVRMSSSDQLLRVPAGSRQAEAVEVPWPSSLSRVRLHADPTGGGRLWAWVLDWDENGNRHPTLYHRGLGAGGAWTQVSAPPDIDVTAMGVSPTGELHLGGRVFDLIETRSDVLRRDAVTGEWVSLGLRAQQSEPTSGLQPDGPVNAFAFQGDTLYAASKGVLIWTKQSGNWNQELTGLPACSVGGRCEVYDLGLLPSGELVVGTAGGTAYNFAGVYWRPKGQSSFEQYGVRSGYLNDGHGSGYSMFNLEVTPEGAVFAASETTGVLRLGSATATWQVAGVQGMPAGNCHRLNTLAVGSDGTLVVGSSNGYREALHSSLYRMGPSEDAWTGFGNELGNTYDTTQTMPVLDVALDDEGTLTLVTDTGALYRAAAGSLALSELPGPGSPANAVEVLAGGALYVGAQTWDTHVWQQAPGGASWEAVPTLPGLQRLVRTADGTLWARAPDTEGAYRLAPAGPGWEWLRDGLSEHLAYGTFAGAGLALDTDGSVLLPTKAGLFRWSASAARWEPVGFGSPSRGVWRVAVGGGRLYVVGEDFDYNHEAVFELDRASGAWVPASEGLPQRLEHMTGFEALPDGRLVLLAPNNCAGVMRSVDAP